MHILLQQATVDNLHCSTVTAFTTENQNTLTLQSVAAAMHTYAYTRMRGGHKQQLVVDAASNIEHV
jgi:hypothetical protein